MLTIRLFRVGKKNQPSFKIVVIDKRKASNKGRFVEEVGFLNPLTKEKILRKERINYWLSVGAKPSDTLYNLLVSEKIIEGKKIAKHKKVKKEQPKEVEAPASSPEALAEGEKPEEISPPEEKKEIPAPEEKEEVKKHSETDERKTD
ncbi:MAG: 30S ribosomal protein S16 [Candidatus Nealsonbacteria bacterium]|nr:MAG: 30S ribosomal protein S16 [Candidatus Nealsonbacteria bacterium]